MSRKLQIVLGVCLFSVICIFGLWHAGLLQHGRANAIPTAAVNPAPASSSVTATQASALTSAANGVLPSSPSGLNDSDPSTFIAVRYDKTHVIFRLGGEGDFILEDPEQEKTFHQLPPQIAEYGLAPPSELDPAVFEKVKQHYAVANVGDHWELEVAPGVRAPVVIQKPIEMSWECANNYFTAGFIAEVAPEFQAAFKSAPQKYFLVHKVPPAAGSPSFLNPTHIAELKDWNPTSEVRAQIEALITAKLKEEISQQYAKQWTHMENLQSPEVKADYDAWKQFAEKTAAGEGKLTYESQAFQLSPDAIPRVLVRAQWSIEIEKDRGVLMSFWLRLEPTVSIDGEHQPGTRTMWAKPGSGGEEDMNVSELTMVLNVFDRPDGYGDVLIFTPGYEGYSMNVYRYTDKGWADTAISIADGC